METLLQAKQIISRALSIPVDQIPDDGKISDIGQLDSLSFEKLVIELEKTIGHEVNPVSLLELRSVKDLTNILKSK